MKNKVTVFYEDGMPVNFNLRDTVDRCRRFFNRLGVLVDIYVYSSTAGCPMVKIAKTNGGGYVMLRNRNGQSAQYVSPNTLLETLKNGFILDLA